MKKNVLIIGSGGREHAIGWKLTQSSKVKKLYFIPGNAGTESIGTNTAIPVNDHKKIISFIKKNAIDFVVVTPDDPLAAGLVNDLTAKKIPAFGPTKEAAEIEWSKAFAKDAMKNAHIPTAAYETFSSYDAAKKYLKTQNFPIVIKASGLALGKGVMICKTLEEAHEALQQCMVDAVFGEAGKTVVIEEFLEGREISFHVFCDGKTYKMFPTSKDHKTIFENNKGPNTGGMGTITPVPNITNEIFEEVKNKIVFPLLNYMENIGRPFQGCLYPGVILTKNGPKVLEFNARFGDPETQSYMRVLKTDLFDILDACVEGKLSQQNIEWSNESACCVVIASKGYPGKYDKNIEIPKLNEKINKDVVLFHAGTVKREGKYYTNGGRVLAVSATGRSLTDALKKAYEAVDVINFQGGQYRKDIGQH